MELIRFFSIFAVDFNINFQKLITSVRKVYIALLACMLICIGCEWHLKPADEHASEGVEVERFDRIQALYLTTGDRSALQQLNTRYPEQMRMLIEDVLKIGAVNDPLINAKFLQYYQDSILLTLVTEAEKQYADLSELNKEMTLAFRELQKLLPDIQVPVVYAQIGALTQSVIVGDSTLGISLDKYLGADFPLYSLYYPEGQRKQMTRQMIVPDCMSFFILSKYPLHEADSALEVRRQHMGKIQWVVNKVTKKRVFVNEHVRAVENYMHNHRQVTVPQLLEKADSLGI